MCIERTVVSVLLFHCLLQLEREDSTASGGWRETQGGSQCKHAEFHGSENGIIHPHARPLSSLEQIIMSSATE
jgi:hypothetical protein